MMLVAVIMSTGSEVKSALGCSRSISFCLILTILSGNKGILVGCSVLWAINRLSI